MIYATCIGALMQPVALCRVSLKTICVVVTTLKTSSKCSFAVRKLHFFACFCLVLTVSPTFLEAPCRGSIPLFKRGLHIFSAIPHAGILR